MRIRAALRGTGRCFRRAWVAAVHPRRRAAVTLAAAVLAPLLLAALARVCPSDAARYLDVPRSGELLDRSGVLLHPFLNRDQQWCFARGLDSFSPRLIQATIATEDQRFHRHWGIDPTALARACLENLRHRGIASGASTLSMQVVKLTERMPRSILGKIEQAWGALRLEAGADKTAILNAYLNKAPYGLNLVGAEAAARRYFGKPASELTISEAALLAGLPKSPTAYEPVEHPKQAQARRGHVLRRMRAEGFITPDEFDRALTAPLGAAWHEFPRLAPHLASNLRARLREEPTLTTTLDGGLQARLERKLSKYLGRFEGEVDNAAAIIVDAASASVLARAGGADFFRDGHGGQVDLCQGLRSPGSTLKPFTYALAIENNRLYPAECLLDDTLDLGKYNPTNFEGDYNGLVTATEALQLSLNIPAIMTLERVGADRLQDFLRRAGITTLTKPASYYGLGLTVGDCEVRLDEMVAAYTMLANLGVYRPLRQFENEPETQGTPLLSRGAALALYTMLDQPFPNETDPSLARASGVRTRVCWKTGTSAGFHDAWSFAYNQQYVVGVWVGNTGSGTSKRLVGARAALPLAASLFRMLPASSAPAWPEAGDDLKRVQVCALSGLPASQWCPAKKEAVIPRSQYTHRRCDVHCPQPGQDRVAERWPGSSKGWDLASITNPVSVSRGENAAAEQRVALRIKAPSNKAQYILTGEPGGDRIRLDASLDGQTLLHWYLDERYLGSSGQEMPMFLNLAPGQHKVTCLAPDGATDSVSFEVLSAAPAAPLKTS